MNIEIKENCITGESIVRLPIGVEIEGKLEKEVELSPITGRVEEALGKQSHQNNPGKIITILLQQCIKRIGSKTNIELGDIMKMLVPDRDYLALCLRALSSGLEMETLMTCTECNFKQRVFYGLEELKVGYSKKYITDIPVKLKHGINLNGTLIKDIVVRIPNGYDQELVAEEATKNPGKARTLLLSRIIKIKSDEDISIPLDAVRDMTISDRDIVNNAINLDGVGVDFNTTIECRNCGAKFSGMLVGGGQSFL